MLIIFNSSPSVRGDGWNAHYTVDCIDVGTVEKTFNDLAIYPNPAHDILNISFSVNELQSVKLQLTSVSGKTVYSETVKVNTGKFEKGLNLASFAQGLYMIQITTDKGISTSKVVIQ